MKNLIPAFEKYIKDEVLSEEAKQELDVIFESMVAEAANERIESEKRAITEEYDSKFEAVVEEYNAKTKEQINDYMKHCVDEFVTENKVAIKNVIVVEKAKQIIDGIQAVFEKNGIKLPEGNESLVSEMNTRKQILEIENTKILNENIELKKDAVEAQKAVIFLKATNGMSTVSQEKLLNLMSGLVTESVKDFSDKLAILKKTVIGEAKKKKVTKEEDEEEVNKDEVEEEDEVKDVVDKDEEDEEKKDKVAKEERLKVDGYLSRLRK